MSGQPLFLDTLEQLRKVKESPLIVNYLQKGVEAGNGGRGEALTPLQKRARSKFTTQPLVLQLAELRSPLEKMYRNTFYCADAIVRDGNNVKTKYCGLRWCVTCNRIRTGKLINSYKPVLDELQDLQFITLTAPTTTADKLASTINERLSDCRKIQDLLRKRGVKILGLRKLEVTYNEKADWYHPHLHLLVSGRVNAELILEEWLKKHPESNRGAQDITPANEGSVRELFKYFTKLTADSGKILPRELDVIFTAMKGKRVFQPIGKLRKAPVSEELENIKAICYAELSTDKKGFYEWAGNDWYNLETGEGLCDYVPSNAIKEFIKKIEFIKK